MVAGGRAPGVRTAGRARRSRCGGRRQLLVDPAAAEDRRAAASGQDLRAPALCQRTATRSRSSRRRSMPTLISAISARPMATASSSAPKRRTATTVKVSDFAFRLDQLEDPPAGPARRDRSSASPVSCPASMACIGKASASGSCRSRWMASRSSGRSALSTGLYAGVCFHSGGFSYNPAAGYYLAEFVANGRTSIDLSAFSPDRFVADRNDRLPAVHRAAAQRRAPPPLRFVMTPLEQADIAPTDLDRRIWEDELDDFVPASGLRRPHAHLSLGLRPRPGQSDRARSPAARRPLRRRDLGAGRRSRRDADARPAGRAARLPVPVPAIPATSTARTATSPPRRQGRGNSRGLMLVHPGMTADEVEARSTATASRLQAVPLLCLDRRRGAVPDHRLHARAPDRGRRPARA